MPGKPLQSIRILTLCSSNKSWTCFSQSGCLPTPRVKLNRERLQTLWQIYQNPPKMRDHHVLWWGIRDRDVRFPAKHASLQMQQLNSMTCYILKCSKIKHLKTIGQYNPVCSIRHRDSLWSLILSETSHKQRKPIYYVSSRYVVVESCFRTWSTKGACASCWPSYSKLRRWSVLAFAASKCRSKWNCEALDDQVFEVNSAGLFTIQTKN